MWFFCAVQLLRNEWTRRISVVLLDLWSSWQVLQLFATSLSAVSLVEFFLLATFTRTARVAGLSTCGRLRARRAPARFVLVRTFHRFTESYLRHCLVRFRHFSSDFWWCAYLVAPYFGPDSGPEGMLILYSSQLSLSQSRELESVPCLT